MSSQIRDLPVEERPRERLLRHGMDSLSSVELLALLMRSGLRGRSVLQIAQDLIHHFGSLQSISEATIEELCQIRGLGEAKAIQIKAAFTLGKRIKPDDPQSSSIDSPQQAYQLVREKMEDQKQELFGIILKNAKGHLIQFQIISMGTLSETLVHPREVFYPAIRHKAAGIILVHNHPSGDPTPSPEDFDLTEAIIQASKVVGIPVHDHIIVGKNQYYSFRQKGFKFECH